MTPVESCIFDQDSRYLLKGGCCDLNCTSAQDENGVQCHEEMDTLIEWRAEKAPEGQGSSGLKSDYASFISRAHCSDLRESSLINSFLKIFQTLEQLFIVHREFTIKTKKA